MGILESMMKRPRMDRKDAYRFGGNRFGYGDYNSIHRSIHSYNIFVLNTFVQLLEEPRNDIPVLDLATGRGGQADYLETHGMTVLRTDLSTHAACHNLHNAREIENSSVIQSDVTDLPFPKASFKGLHMKDALVHVRAKQRLFSEISRVLVYGGIACITTELNSGVINNMLRTILSGSLYTRVNQPQIMKIAEQNSLRVARMMNWAPYSKERDWYSDGRGRCVLFFRKA